MHDYAPFRGTGQWFKGNLHTHTTVSDGLLPPEEVARLYRENGYNFLAMTDHNVLTDWQEHEASGFLVLPGIETEVIDEQGGVCYHFVGIQDRSPGRKYGHLEDPGFRTYGGTDSAQAVIDRMVESGMHVVFCHPVWSRTELRHFEELTGYLAVEIYNHGCHVECNTGHAAVYWDSLLRRGKRVWGMATDDSHHRLRDSLGGWVMVYAEALSIDSILESLTAGRFYSSSGPVIYDFGALDGEVFLECSPVREIHFVSYEQHGMSFVSEPGEVMRSARHRLTGKEKYVRAECTDIYGRTAWSNPIFLGRK